MNVTDAVMQRKSIRRFLPTPVSDDTIRELLAKASRAPSGGNVQPWEIYVVNGAARDRLVALTEERPLERAEYEVYPADLWEPHRSARFTVGEQMYALLGIPREDRPARLANLAKNYTLFGAPASIFCFVDRRMGGAQWSDLGMFLQTFMLLAEEAGLATCAQEAWANRCGLVAEFVDAPQTLMLFSGIAIGHRDPDAPVNTLVSERRPVDDFATFLSD